VVNKVDRYKFNPQAHSNNSTQKFNSHQTASNLTTHKKATYYHFGITVFNKLPSHIKILSQHVKHFKSA